MNKLVIALLIISLIGNVIGLFVVYKHFQLKKWLSEAEQQLGRRGQAIDALNESVAKLTAELDDYTSKRMVFLHHSVGQGILNQGGLRNKLLDMGILVKSATYGDDIGEDTDMNHWVVKFEERMNDVFAFSSHGNQYRADGKTNDVVMFKSCFPNSGIVGEGELPGDPTSPERTMANYKATFERLKPQMAQYPNKLFIYLTAPPQVPEVTTPDKAQRAREFNDWLLKEFQPQYASETGNDNFYVFDLFGVLANDQGYLKEAYRVPKHGDCHPNKKGSEAASAALLQFFKPIWEKWEKQPAGV